MRRAILLLALAVIFPAISRAQAAAGAPDFEVTPVNSSIKFYVKASVSIAGKFDKWDAALTFRSPDVTSGALTVTIQADTVDTGSGMKNGKLKGKDFFDVANNPSIVFQSTQFTQTGPNTIEVDGNFTIRGVSKPEKLVLIVAHKEGRLEEIEGKMTFNRKDYGMNRGIPFVKIGDHVDVTFNLKVKHAGGPALNMSQHTGA